MPPTTPPTSSAAAPSPPVGGRLFWALLLAATLMGAGLRLYNLGSASFWLDELHNIRTMNSLSEGRWQFTKVLGYLPSYAGLLAAGVDPSQLDRADPSGWRAAGVTELNARLPTALIGVASVPLLALASRRLLGDRAAVILAFLLAVSPWHIYWSQAARFYIVQFLFYNASLAIYFTATRPGRPLARDRLLTALALAVLAFMSQPTAIILGAVCAVDWAVAALRLHRDSPVRLGAFGWAASLGAVACCVLLFAGDALTGRNTLAQALSDPIHQTPFRFVLASTYLIWPSVTAFAALAGLYLLRDDPRLAVYLGAAAAVPILFFAALSVGLPVGSRYAFISTFAVLALAAAALDRTWGLVRPHAGLPLAAAPIAALLDGSLTATLVAHQSGGNLHSRWREAVAALNARRAPGEPVYASSVYIASYYLGERALPLPASPDEVAAIPHTAWFVIDNTSSRPTRRFWLLPHAELVDYFPLRAPHAGSCVQVYRHSPP